MLVMSVRTSWAIFRSPDAKNVSSVQSVRLVSTKWRAFSRARWSQSRFISSSCSASVMDFAQFNTDLGEACLAPTPDGSCTDLACPTVITAMESLVGVGHARPSLGREIRSDIRVKHDDKTDDGCQCHAMANGEAEQAGLIGSLHSGSSR